MYHLKDPKHDEIIDYRHQHLDSSHISYNPLFDIDQYLQDIGTISLSGTQEIPNPEYLPAQEKHEKLIAHFGIIEDPKQ